VACCVAGFTLLVPDVAGATTAPKIVAGSAEVGENEATLKASIQPGGLQTTYKFFLESEGIVEVVGEGTIAGSKLEAEVSVELKSLKYDHTYVWSVTASNSDGLSGRGGMFETGSPPPGCPYGCPVKGPEGPHAPPLEQWNIEGSERAAREAPRLEAERVAKKRHEEEEVAAKERALREAGERAGREAAEREALAPSVRCIVPRLEGDSLAKARRALQRAHCSLGKVHTHKHVGALVVTEQSSHAGRRLASEAPVGVTLGPRLSQRHR
jgi:hypothetical protein